MRTTVVLPLDLIRAAKARSAESGESLKTFLTRAVAAELETQVARPGRKARMALPMFGRAEGPRVRITNADLEQALADADAASVSKNSTSKRRERTR